MEGEKVVGKRNGTAWLKGKMRKKGNEMLERPVDMSEKASLY